jgi:type IV secretory pathway component VirB8
LKLLIKKTNSTSFSFISFLFVFANKTITALLTDLKQAKVLTYMLLLIKESQLKFAIADTKGRYKLELDAAVKYEITASYIGYKEEITMNKTARLPITILFKSTG